MKYKILLLVAILFSTMQTTSHAGNGLSKDWFWQTGDGELVFAATKNSSGHILGHYCSQGLEDCFYLIAIDLNCLSKGQIMSATANSNMGDIQLQLVCMGKSEKKWVLIVNPFEEFDNIVRKAKYIKLSIPVENEQVKISQFSLTGSSSAIKAMKLDAKIANKDIILSDYQVKIKVYHELIICNITFNNIPKSSNEAEIIVCKALETQAAIFPNHEIMAMAFNSDGQSIPDWHYGGVLFYDPVTRKIMTDDERDGLKTIGLMRNSYFLQIREGKTANGITPERKWLTLSIVFPTKPSNKEIKNIVIKETAGLKERGIDITTYIYQGEQKNKMTWKQVLAPNEKFMKVEYTTKSGLTTPNWEWD